MRVKVTDGFKFAIDGIHVVDVAVGAIVEGRCAEVALETKRGEQLGAGPVVTAAPVSPPDLTEAEVQQIVDREPEARGDLAPAAVEAPTEKPKAKHQNHKRK